MTFLLFWKSAEEKAAEAERIRERIARLKRQRETGRPSTVALADALLSNEDIDRELAKLEAKLASLGA